MDEIIIPQTDSNPFIEIKAEGCMIKGNSFVTDPREFYTAVLDWAKAFKAGAGENISLDIVPGYYSTSNIQVFNLLLKTLDANNPGHVDVTFYVDQDEEEDMQETIYSLTFNTGLEPLIKYK